MRDKHELDGIISRNLTEEDQKIVELRKQGLGYKEIAKTLDIKSVATVIQHIDNIIIDNKIKIMQNKIKKLEKYGGNSI